MESSGELFALLEQLVAIDSVNPDLVPGGRGEGEIADFVAAWLAARGAAVHRLETKPGRPSVVGVFAGSGGGRSLLLDGHLDTVGYAGMERPLAPRRDGDRLYGRGAYDMKCGVAAMLVAAAEAAAAGLRGDVLVACVADEEVASFGTADVARQFRADAAIVTEPTALEAVVAHKGFVWATIETRGVAAHGSRPDLGVDAVSRMGRVLVELERLGGEWARRPAHPLLGAASLHASRVTGGEGWSTYPPSCRLDVECRTLPGTSPADVERELRALLDRLAAADPSFRSTLTMDLDRPPHELAVDAPIAAALGRRIEAELGRPARFTGVAYWADCAILSSAGIPTVMFGPDGEGAHAEVEWVSLASVEACARVLAATIRDFCA